MADAKKAEPKAAKKAEPEKPEPKAEQKPAQKPEPKQEQKPEQRPAEQKQADKPTEKREEPTKKTEAKPEIKPLTTANWTPDIVAGGISAFFGFSLAPLLALSLSFIPGWQIRVFAFLALFITAVGIAWISKHMELEGYRLFQQGYFLLLPVSIGFLTTALIIFAIQHAVTAGLGAVTQVTSVIGINTGLSGFVYAPVTTPQEILRDTFIMSGVMLLPFAIQGRKSLKFWWFLPLIIPIALWLLTYYVIGSAAAF